MLKMKQENKGITLVALVVTVVVLLILAGVTITALTGDNGILSQVARAKQENEKAGIIEEIKLDIATKQADNLGSINEDEFYEILSKYGVIRDNETILTTTKGNYEILISDIYSGNIESSLVTTPIESWEYTIYNNIVILDKYIGSDSKIKVPSTFTIDGTTYNTGLNSSGYASSENYSGPFVMNELIEIVKFGEGIKIYYKHPTGEVTVATTVNHLFNRCTNLKHVYNLPDYVTKYEATFYKCSKLEGNLYIKGANVTSFKMCFIGVNNPLNVYVPANSTTFDALAYQCSRESNYEYAYTNVNIKTLDNTKNYIKITCYGDSLTAGQSDDRKYPMNLHSAILEKNIVYNAGVGGYKSNQIVDLNEKILKVSTIKDDIQILWMGTNGGWNNDPSTLISQYETLIARFGSDKYIVIGIPIDNTGTLTVDNLKQLETAMSNKFGEHYINMREYLVTNGLSDAGIEATSEDLSRISEGKVPTSLLYDNVHYNSSGYSVISDCIYNKLKALNYINQ